MNGRQKREHARIFAAFENSDNARISHATKVMRDEIDSMVKDAEEFLGIKPEEELTGNIRQKVMISVYELKEVVNECLAEIYSLTDQHDSDSEENADMADKLEAMNRHVQYQDKLIELYQQLSVAESQERQDLQGKIDQLVAQNVENHPKPRKKREPARAQTPEERQQALEARIRKCEARHEKLLAELNEAYANGCEEEPEVVADDPFFSAEIPDVVLVSCDLPVDEPDTEKSDPGSADTNDVTSCSDTESSDTVETEVNDDSESAQEEKNESSSAEETSNASLIEAYKARIAELEAEREEMNFKAHQDSHTSNTPSGKEAPWKTAKPASGPTSPDSTETTEDKTGDNDSQEGTQSEDDAGRQDEAGEQGKASFDEEDDIEREEAEAEEKALHDPEKSPNKKKGSGKRGKKPGSSGGGRKMPVYDQCRVEKCISVQCQGCPHRETCEALKNASGGEKRYSYDIEITRVMTEFTQVSCQCPMEEGKVLSGEFPEGINNWFQYGNNLKALAITLNTVGMVSYDRIADIVKGLIQDEHFCGRTVNSWVQATVDKINPAIRYIKAGVFGGDYLNCDESGVKVKGVLHWVHTACNPEFTYLRVDRQRGANAINRIGVLPAYVGTLISDCLASYWEKGSRHGLCNAHLLRELFALVKYFKRDKEWAQEMMDLLNEMNDERNKLIAENVDHFSEEQLKDYRQRFEAIVEKGLKIHPDSENKKSSRGKEKKARGRNLLDRLAEHEDNFLLFLDDFNVPFTNNAAERSLRLFSIKRSVVGSFDTYEGADGFAVLWSYISTARKRDLNAFEAIRAAVDGKAVDFLFDDEEQDALEEIASELKKINTNQFYKDRQSDKEEVLEAKADAEEKKRKAAAAEKKAVEAEAQANQMKEEVLILGTESVIHLYQKAVAAASRARATADSKSKTAQKANEKVKELMDKARWRSEAAMYFLEVEDLEWDFDKEMAS